jgi:uncharacterized protein DUF4062/iSTAND domain-containing protein
MSVSTRIYISSPYRDLIPFRRRAAEEIRRLGHIPVGMEADGASERPPLERCLEDVASCQGYVGIIGFRYGSCPPGMAKSYTELEYEKAGQQETPHRLIFVANKDAQPYEPRYVENDDPRLKGFKARVSKHSIGSFSSLKDLADGVETAVRQTFGFGKEIPDLLPYLCDRRDQEQALEAALPARPERRPVLLILHGDQEEAHFRFIDRLRWVTIPNLTGDRTVFDCPLRWPETRADFARLSDWFTRELARTVLEWRSGPVPTLDEIFARLAKLKNPVLLSSVTDHEAWTTNEEETLLAFMRLWEQCPDLPAHQPLIACLAIKYSLAVPPAGWRVWRRWTGSNPAAVFEGLTLRSTPRLTVVQPPRLGHQSVSRQDVDNWMAVQVRPRARELGLDLDALEGFIGGIFKEAQQARGSSFIAMTPLADGLKKALQVCSTQRHQGLFA